MNSGFRTIAINSAYLLGGRGINIAARLLYAVILTRALGPEMYGLLNYAFAWYLAFIPVAVLGLPAILLRTIGRNPASAGVVVSISFSLVILASLCIALMSYGLGLLVEPQERMHGLMAILTLALLGRALSEWAHAVHLGYGSAKWVFRLEAAIRPFEVILGVIALALGASLEVLVLIHAMVWLLQAMALLLTLQRQSQLSWPRWDLAQVSLLMREGVPLAISSLCYIWLMQGILVLGKPVLPSPEDLGQLALAVQLLVLLMIVPRSVGAAIVPVASRSLANEEGSDLRYTNTMLRMSTLLAGVLASTAMVLGGVSTRWVFGDAYLTAGVLLGPILWLLLPLTWGSAFYLYMINRRRWLAVLSSALIGAAAMTFSLPLLGRAYGLDGVVSGAMIGASAWAFSLGAVYFREQAAGLKGVPGALLSAISMGLLVVWLEGPLGTWVLLLTLPLGLVLAVLGGAITAAERTLIGRIVRMPWRPQ